MKKCRIWHGGFAAFIGLVTAACLSAPTAASAGAEETFQVLQIGARAYTNVTVTTKSKSYIFIVHSAGMTNIKVAELPPELREQLGYVDPEKARTNTPAAWAKQTLAKLDTPQVKGMEEQVVRTLLNNPVSANVKLPEITPTLVAVVGGTLISLYLFFSYCCMLICQKAGRNAGALVWLPVFQVFPMLRAARMSGWWFLALFIPVLNLVTQIIWCIKIVQAREKNGWLALLLLLPLTNVFAFLFLAFADGESPKREQKPVAEIMTLETA